MLLFPGSVPHGASMTVEALDIAFSKLNDIYGCLPPTVLIQLDNCSDNKAKTVLAYLFDLRRRGILRQAKICMLIVGHTHIGAVLRCVGCVVRLWCLLRCVVRLSTFLALHLHPVLCQIADIDQWFGVLSRALTREEALSFPSYVRILKGAFALERNAPDAIEIVTTVHDWDAYYAGCIDPHFARFGLDSKSGEAVRVFKFDVDEKDAAVMRYKDYMTSNETKPRPYQAGAVYKPGSEVEARSVFGSVWDEMSASAKEQVMRGGLTCGISTYDRSTKLWRTELDVGRPGFFVKARSPGIKLFVKDPEGEPAVAAVPPLWYSTCPSSRQGNIFLQIERTLSGMIAEGYFRADPAGERWWRQFFSSHRPSQQDGSCTARDIAMSVPRSWPRASPTVGASAPPPVAHAQAGVTDGGDQVEYTGHRGAARRRGQAALDEAVASGTIVAVAGQLVVCIFEYETDVEEDAELRFGLGQVESADESGDYSVHWLCRKERGSVRKEDFSLTGKYRKARPSDFGADQDDQSVFRVEPANLVCVLSKTKRGHADVPVIALNESGTIPNPRLASGLTMHQFIAKAVSEQRDKHEAERGARRSASSRSAPGPSRCPAQSPASDSDDEESTEDLVLEMRVTAWAFKTAIGDCAGQRDGPGALRELRKNARKVLERDDGERVLFAAAMCGPATVAQFRAFAGGEPPHEGLCDLIRGPVEVGTGALYSGDYSHIGVGLPS